MSLVLACVPPAGLVALHACAIRHAARRRRASDPLSASSILWALPQALVLALIAIWGFFGLLEGMLSPVVVPLVTLVVCGASFASLTRDELWRRMDAYDAGRRHRIELVVLATIALGAVMAIEVPFNEWMPLGGPTYLWLELTLVSLLLAALYFLGQRHGGLCVAGVAFCLVCGIGQHFVGRFKNAAILPTDLLALGTAAAVTGEYTFTLGERPLLGIACASLAIAGLSLIRPHRMPQAPLRAACGNLGIAAALAATLAAAILLPPYGDLLGVRIMYWYSIDYYQMQGFLPTFIAVMQDMAIPVPSGYSDQEAARVLSDRARDYRAAHATDDAHREAAAQFSQTPPSIIVVMNESFADLSRLDGLHIGYEGPTFFRDGFPDALLRGTLNVCVHGGGTCNTEFEFLTGNAASFLGGGKYPYSVYDFTGVDALPAQLKDLGYQTCAIHPNYATNWNRDTIYRAMGFDTFLSIDDFGGPVDTAIDTVTPNEPHAAVFHSGVADEETYDRILGLLRTDERPQLIFDVTMASHGSYDQGNIPEAYGMHANPPDAPDDEGLVARLNEYLSCVWRADDDLAAFVGSLRELTRPVVLVFFGDHQPTLTSELNDAWYPNEEVGAHARRIYCSDYVVWANYDVAGHDQAAGVTDISADMLAATTLDLIGAPLSDFQAAQLDIRRQIPSLSAIGYLGADGHWYAPDDASSPFADSYRDLSLLEYLNFATRV